jgi:dienelactone hydrolase
MTWQWRERRARRLGRRAVHRRRLHPRHVPTRRGPGVVVVHEIPGITPKVAQFANDVVDAGFTV